MLELKHISVGVDGNKEILKDVNLTVADDRFVAITGPNGGGKSTLAKVIAGIMSPNEGQILFNGQDITALTITERARLGISYAFQQPVRFKGITVRDLLELAAGGAQEESALCDCLRDVGLCVKDYIGREVDASLSGGESKRIEIAMAIARHAPFTVFDEPEAGIDLWSFQNLIGVFQRLRQRKGGSVLVISHQERILNIADDIVVMAGGRVTACGPRQQVLPALLQGEGVSHFCPKQEAVS